MTFVFWQHPLILALFLLSAALCPLTARLQRYAGLSALGASLSILALVLCALVYALPLTEILILLLLLLLSASLACPKGGPT